MRHCCGAAWDSFGARDVSHPGARQQPKVGTIYKYKCIGTYIYVCTCTCITKATHYVLFTYWNRDTLAEAHGHHRHVRILAPGTYTRQLGCSWCADHEHDFMQKGPNAHVPHKVSQYRDARPFKPPGQSGSRWSLNMSYLMHGLLP